MSSGGLVRTNHAMLAHYAWLALAVIAGPFAHHWIAAWGAIVSANIWSAANYIVERR